MSQNCLLGSTFPTAPYLNLYTSQKQSNKKADKDYLTCREWVGNAMLFPYTSQKQSNKKADKDYLTCREWVGNACYSNVIPFSLRDRLRYFTMQQLKR